MVTRTEAAVIGGRRMSIRRLQLVSTTAGISTAVSLGLGTRTFVGEAEAGSSPESVQRAVALATLRAPPAGQRRRRPQARVRRRPVPVAR